MKQGAGGIIYQKVGLVYKILLIEPKNHYKGMTWTFPKGKIDNNETVEQAALREVREESGYEASIGYKLIEYKDIDSQITYYLMKPTKVGKFNKDETASIKWATFKEAEKKIKMTTNILARNRDLRILKEAAFAILSGER